jgi:demethylmenaquinone methyltransferase/2-methoxy-6-polyprenyl-1,4-benzoquinol methylase
MNGSRQKLFFPDAGTRPRFVFEFVIPRFRIAGVRMNSDPIHSPPEADFGRYRVSSPERKRRIRNVFNCIADRYDLMNDLMSFGIHRLWKRSFTARLPEHGMFVDLAGGTGDVAALLARRGGRRIIVLDPSLPMMRAGRDRDDVAGVEWIAGEAEHLPFADASVDVLTVSFGLRNATRLDAAIAEVARVLRPGGTFACLEFSRPQKWFQLLYDPYSLHVIPRLGAWVAKNPAAYEYLVESIRNFPDQRRFAEMLEAGGLGEVSWRNLSLGIACIHQACRPHASAGRLRRAAAGENSR